jgi:acyl transferase domain-containing protein
VKNSREPIAIVGMSCRFPGADDLTGYWRLLADGADAIGELPRDRGAWSRLYDPDPRAKGALRSRHGGFLTSVDGFDSAALRVLPREARQMDPQQRLLLELAWEAFEDAAVPLSAMAGSRTGVFVGLQWNDYLRLLCRRWSQLDGYSVVGNLFAFAANRISHGFDLRGPSVAIESGCTSGLVALQQACHSLWLGECDWAVAGAVELMLSPDSLIMMSETGMLSPSGRCRPLDARADGFVRGEGGGLVLLKPVSKLTVEDRPYALVRGITAEHNGRNEWLVASSGPRQRAVVVETCRRAGVAPAAIDYFELHSTGNLKGDAIEVNALGQAIARDGAERTRIGSVKGNIGHLGAASAVASLIKVALALAHRQIPPTRGLESVQAGIDLERLGLEAPRRLTAWPDRRSAPTAGVLALSLGGVSSCAVLEAAEPRPKARAARRRELVLPLSARCEGALRVLARRYRTRIAALPDDDREALEGVCYTAALGRAHLEHRLAVVGRTARELARALDAAADAPAPAAGETLFAHAGERPPLVWIRGEPHDAGALGELLRRSGIAIDLEADTRQSPWLAAAAGLVSLRDALLAAGSDERALVLWSGEPPPLRAAGAGEPSLVLVPRGAAAIGQLAAELYRRGFTVDWRVLYPRRRPMVRLPSYPFQRRRLWPEWLAETEPDAGAIAERPVAASAEPSLGERLAGAPADERAALLGHYLRAQIARALRLESADSLDEQTPLVELGLESMAASHLKQAINIDLQLDLPVAELIGARAIAELASRIATLMAERALLAAVGGASGDRNLETFQI